MLIIFHTVRGCIDLLLALLFILTSFEIFSLQHHIEEKEIHRFKIYNKDFINSKT